MYKITVIESAEELLRFANPNRGEGDDTPYIGSGKLVFENNMTQVKLEGSASFELCPKVSASQVIKALAKNANFDVHIT